MSTIFVNADWSAIVPAGSPDAAFGVQPRDAKRLGVDKLPVKGDAELPADLPEPETLKTIELRSASLREAPPAEAEAAPAEESASPPEAPAEPEPEVKEAATPANKAAPRPATKGAARKEPVDGDSH